MSDGEKMTLDGAMDLASVAEVENVALQGWPGLEVEEIDGWLLRHAFGITRRANSVWPNRTSGDYGLDFSVAQVEEFYHARALPARFQICPAAQPRELDDMLSERGYRAVARTAVQTTSLQLLRNNLDGVSALSVELMTQPSALWWACYANADDVPSESVAVRQAICGAIKLPAAYATAVFEGEVIAVGSATVAAEWVGFVNIATRKSHRRMGAARAVMAALAQWGETQGATNAYLQVMAGNEAALQLYSQLSFTTGYFYHYREETIGRNRL